MVELAEPAPKKENPLKGLIDGATKLTKSIKLPSTSAPKPLAQTYAPTRLQNKSIISTKFIIAMVLVLIVGIALFSLYISLTLNSIRNAANVHPTNLPKPQIRSTVQSQDLLDYNNKQYMIPFSLIQYSSNNVSNIYVNATILNYTPPRDIYVLNVSDECWQSSCGNYTGVISEMENYLIQYKLITSPENITTISPSNVRNLPPDSILIVLNGLLPSDFLQQVSPNTTVLDHLLSGHTSIIYIGENFSTVVTHHQVSEPTVQALPQGFIFPNYLRTSSRMQPPIPSHSGFYFDSFTFQFYNGTNYTAMSYEDIENGSLVMFPTTSQLGWKNTNQEGHDIAKAIQQLFWLRKTGYGAREITLSSTKNSTGEIGVLLNVTKINRNASFTQRANTGLLRVWMIANGSYYIYNSNSTYEYLTATPKLYYNGSLGINNFTIINQSTSINMTLLTGSPKPIKITFPYIELYDLNMSPAFVTELPALANVSGNFTFYYSQLFLTAPGKGYILKMFDGSHLYSSAYFAVAPLNISIRYANFTPDKFRFYVTSEGQPVTNIKYTMTLNGAYPQNGVIVGSFINYSTPPHTPTLHGVLNFELNVSGGKSYYTTYYYILPFGISPEYIEIAVVLAMVLVMIIFVRAPHRDEFYIDVPNLPEEKKTKIILRPNEIVEVFDKLNASYKWKYMPLSKPEIRSAIATNMRVNNIPVGLTYNNVERLLDQLTVKKYIVSADELYAPIQWIEQSKHDIEYLATFKKLRLYLVTHAYIFTDLDTSTNSDIVATLHSERKYIVIYSKTSKFKKVPIYTGSTTYIAFLNSYKLEEFKNTVYNSAGAEAEELKMYIDADLVRLMDADNPEGLTS